MAQFLSEKWIAELTAAAERAPVDPSLDLVLQQVVTDPTGPDVTYAICLGDGRATVVPGKVDSPHITFTQDRATAKAIASGELSAQAAFMAGRLRVAGDLRTVLARSRELTALDDLLAPARTTTTW